MLQGSKQGVGVTLEVSSTVLVFCMV